MRNESWWRKVNQNISSDNETYFDSFGAVFIPKENKKFVRCKNVITNYYWVQAYDWRMCGCISTGFIYFMTEFSLLDCTSFFPKKYFKKVKTILKCFQ